MIVGRFGGTLAIVIAFSVPPKQSHNPLVSYSRPRPSLIFKVGYRMRHFEKMMPQKFSNMITRKKIILQDGTFCLQIERSGRPVLTNQESALRALYILSESPVIQRMENVSQRINSYQLKRKKCVSWNKF